jgi:hypothetical protein
MHAKGNCGHGNHHARIRMSEYDPEADPPDGETEIHRVANVAVETDHNLLSYREFRRAGTSVQGSNRSTAIVQTGPYRFSRNPIYLAFILLVLGLSVWLNNLWLLVTLVPATGLMAVVIPREERFLERNFPGQYSSYKAAVRRWLWSATICWKAAFLRVIKPRLSRLVLHRVRG